jgi:hypothetical protein
MTYIGLTLMRFGEEKECVNNFDQETSWKTSNLLGPRRRKGVSK